MEKRKIHDESLKDVCTSKETIHPDGRKDVNIFAPTLVFDLEETLRGFLRAQEARFKKEQFKE